MANDNPNSRGRFAFNTLLSIATWGFPLLLAFVATPIIVRGLGNEKYGVYAITLVFVSTAFSSGIGRISAKYIPELRSSGREGEISEIVSATFWLTLTVGIIQAGALAIAAPYIVSDILLVEPEAAREVVTALYLASAGGLVLMLSFTFQFVLQGIHRFDRIAIISGLSALLLNVGNIIIVLSGLGVLPLLGWNAAVLGSIGLLYYLTSRRSLPDLRLTFDVRRATFITISKYALSIAVYQGLTSLFFLFERTWIVRHFGTETLTFYVIPMTLAIYLHGLVASAVQVLFPAVNELINDRERMIGLYKKSTKVILVVIVLFLGSYYAAGREFLTLWIGGEFAARSYLLLVILSSAMGLNAVGIVAWQLTEAFKHPALNALSTALWLVVSIPLMIFAVDRWQSDGVAIARLIGVVATIPIIFYVERKFLGQYFWGFWAGSIFRLGLAAAGMMFVESQILKHAGTHWLSLVGGVAAGIIVFFGILLLASYFSKQEIAVALNTLFPKDRSEGA